MRFLVVAQGSYGDINPHAGIAVELKERGHEVVFIASEYFEPLTARLGLELVPTMSRAEYLRVVSHPDFKKITKAGQLITKSMVIPEIELIYKAIADRYQPGNTAVLAPFTAIGARLANEQLGVPLATLHLGPIYLRSVDFPSAMSADRYRRLPLPLKKGLRGAVEWYVDRLLGEETNRFRRKLGLAAVRPVRDRWLDSPELAVGMFPEWFWPYQPDWSPHVRLTGFPMFDGSAPEGLRPEVEEFLAAGSPPVVVNALSALAGAREYVEKSVATLQLLGRRGILLSPFPDAIPKNLPPEIGYFGYVPHTPLLPRAAAILHQGGMGTTAKSMAAGIPQIVIPLFHDQFFNARQVTDLGLGAMLYGFQFKPARVAKILGHLLGSEAVARNCAESAGRFRGEDGAVLISNLVEETFRARS